MTRQRLLISAAVLTLLVTACGDDGSANTTTTVGETATTLADVTTTQAEPASMATLGVAATDLGEVLVDGEGYTLYLFTNDEQNSGTSTCEGDCLANWPAVGELEAGDGVDAALIGMIERSDGSIQATYNGWPLYYFANDTAAGDTTGQGVNDVWYAVTPDGNPVGMEDAG